MGVSSTQLPRLESKELCQWSPITFHDTSLFSLFILLEHVSKFNIHITLMIFFSSHTIGLRSKIQLFKVDKFSIIKIITVSPITLKFRPSFISDPETVLDFFFYR